MRRILFFHRVAFFAIASTRTARISAISAARTEFEKELTDHFKFLISPAKSAHYRPKKRTAVLRLFAKIWDHLDYIAISLPNSPMKKKRLVTQFAV
jgi:hypothetical protein